MDKLTVKYRTHSKALPPQPIRVKMPGWGGSNVKMQDGAEAQPWHCLPFAEGSIHGLELLYPYDAECQVVNDHDGLRFDGDFSGDAGIAMPGGGFLALALGLAPNGSPRCYQFNTGLDVQTPPGQVVRIEPHPRFFTDDTETVPLAMIGHMTTPSSPGPLSVVFRAPEAGQRHIFRKGEPYAQIYFVPEQTSYTLTRMTAHEEGQRRQLAKAIETARFDIADNNWQNADGIQQDNHYKILARVFARDGLAGVEDAVLKGLQRHDMGLKGKTIAECLALGSQLMNAHKRREASNLYSHVLTREPNNPEALNNLGICMACVGNIPAGLEMMERALALQPLVPKYHSSLGEILRLLGRFQEAEKHFRSYLQINPADVGIWSVLGLTLAQQGRAEEGLQACRVALTAGKPVPAAHFRMGMVLRQLGKHAEARSSFEAALTLDPQFADARRALNELPATPL